MADKTEYSTRSGAFKPMRHSFTEAEPVRMDSETAKPLRNGASPLEAPLNARQLAEILPLHPVTILKWARQGKIPCHRLSARKIVFLPSEITRWLSDYTNKAVRAA
jgi:Helix-turn-helix domain